MVEIDRALMQWRSQWKAQVPSISSEVLDEMERHLRDSVLARLEDDSDNDAAIKSAIEEFGGPEELVSEFNKVPSERLPWWPVNLVWTVLVISAIAAVTLAVSGSQAHGENLLIRSHVALISFGYVAVAGVGFLSLFFLCWRMFCDPLPGQKRTIGGAARVLCAISAIALLGGIGLGATSVFSSTGSYSWFASRDIAGVVILSWAIFMASQFHANQIRDLQRSALTGLAANIGVLIACYGALAAHGHAVIGGPFVLLTMLVSHGGMAFTAFVPANCLSDFVD